MSLHWLYFNFQHNECCWTGLLFLLETQAGRVVVSWVDRKGATEVFLLSRGMARIFLKVPQFSKSRELPHPPAPLEQRFHASYIQLAPIYKIFPTFSLKINHAFLLWKPTFRCKEEKSPLLTKQKTQALATKNEKKVMFTT